MRNVALLCTINSALFAIHFSMRTTDIFYYYHSASILELNLPSLPLQDSIELEYSTTGCCRRLFIITCNISRTRIKPFYCKRSLDLMIDSLKKMLCTIYWTAIAAIKT